MSKRGQKKSKRVSVVTAPTTAPNVAAIRSEAFAEGRQQGFSDVLERAAQQGTLGRGAYGLAQPMWYASPHSPNRHPGSPVSVDTLRQIADNYDILRACINHLKREMQTTPFSVVPRDEKDKSPESKRRCDQAMTLFEDDGVVGGPGVSYERFESEYLEDLLTVGAGSIWHQRTRAGGWYGCRTIDAATIRPIIDQFGWAPPAGDDAYAQVIYGVEVARFTRDELTYDGIWSNTRSPYYLSPVEWLVHTVNAALRSDQWNMAFLTDGNTPDEMLALPKEWGADQIMMWTNHWNALLSGNSASRRTMKFVPGGSEKVSSATRKEQDFSAFELWLARRTGAIMGVQLASIGFAGEQFKTSQENSLRATRSVGVGSLLAFRRRRLDDILKRAGYADLRTTDASDQEQSAREKAEMLEVKIRSGQMTVNEARQEQGLDPVDGGDVILVPSTLTTLEAIQREPEPEPTPGNGNGNNEQKPPAGNGAGRVSRADSDEKKKLTDDEALAQYRASLVDPTDAAGVTIRTLWQPIADDLQARADALMERIQAARDAGEPVNESWLWRERRFTELISEIRQRIVEVSDAMAAATSTGQAEAIRGASETLQDAAGLDRVLAAMGTDAESVGVSWSAADIAATEALAGRASDGSPLLDLFRAIAPDAEQQAVAILTQAVAEGENPRRTARRLSASLRLGRQRAELIARTEIMAAGREASRLEAIENADILEGIVWTAVLDHRTCRGCWAMHGTLLPPDGKVNDHPNGRCIGVPRLKPMAEITGDVSLPDDRAPIVTGAERFAGLDAARQRSILGPSLFAEYAGGTVELADCVVEATDASGRWGSYRRAATVKEATDRADRRRAGDKTL